MAIMASSSGMQHKQQTAAAAAAEHDKYTLRTDLHMQGLPLVGGEVCWWEGVGGWGDFAHLRAVFGNSLRSVVLQVPGQLNPCRTLLLQCLPSTPQGSLQGPPQLLQVSHVRLLLTWSSPGAVRTGPLSLHGAADKCPLPGGPLLASGSCPWCGSLEGYKGGHVWVTLDRPEGFNSSWLPY